MSAAFDTVDHNILPDRLGVAFGIQGTAPSWIESFVRGRPQRVSFAGGHSCSSSVTCGVPQGSVLGPVIFVLYTADVITIARRHDIGVHSYADDTQLYQHSVAKMRVASIPRLVSCIDNFNKWMSFNRWKLNSDKTDFILLGTHQQLAKINCKSIQINGCDILISNQATFLGALVDIRPPALVSWSISGHLPWYPG